MIWQLLQVGYLQDRPLILLGEMWHGLIEWMRKEMILVGFLNLDELDIPKVVESIEGAVQIIKRIRKNGIKRCIPLPLQLLKN